MAMASATNQQSALSCHICLFANYTKYFHHRASLTNHYYAKHSASYCCQYCVQQFSDGAALADHIKKVHRRGSSWECVFCDFRSSDKKSLLKHHREDHKELEKGSTCNTCETVFYNQRCLQIHTKYCRGEEQRQIIRGWPKKSLDEPPIDNLKHQSLNVFCFRCFKRVPFADFACHLEQHVIGNKETIPCNECFTFIPEESDLVKHLGCYAREAQRWCQYNAGNSPYLLCACGFCASEKKQMEKHKFWCHKNLKCWKCDATLFGLAGARQHHRATHPRLDQPAIGKDACSQSQPQIPSAPIVQQAAVNQGNQKKKVKKVPDLSIEDATSKKKVAKVAAPAAHPVVKEPTANKKSSSALPAKPLAKAAARRKQNSSSSNSDSSDDDQQPVVIAIDKAPAKRPAPSITGNAAKLHRPTVTPRKPPKPVENVSSSSEDEAPVVKKPTTAVAPPEAIARSKASVQQSRHPIADSSDSSSSSSSDDVEREPPRTKSFFSAKELEAARRQPKPASPMVTEFACKLCDYSMPVRQMVMAHLKTEHRVRESLLDGFYVSRQRPRQEIIEKRRFIHRQIQCDGGECSECKQWRKRIKRMEKSLGNLVVAIEEVNEKFSE